MKALEDIYGALQGLVSAATGIEQVILADQGKPAPTGLYATYKPTPVRAYGAPKQKRVDVPAVDCDIEGWTDFEETTVSQMEFMLSVNLIGPGAHDAAWKLHNANYRNPVYQYLFTNQIGWRYASEVKDLTAVSQAAYQPRYHVGVHLYIEAEVTDTVLRAAGFSLSIFDEDENLLSGEQ